MVGRRWLWLALVVAAAGCSRSVPLELPADADRVLVALLSEQGAVERLVVAAPGEVPRFAVRVDFEHPLVTFALRTEDYLHADGREVSVEELHGALARAAFDEDASQADRGACRRCQEPGAGNLQVVHAGDSCPPVLAQGQLYRGADGEVTALSADAMKPEDLEVFVAAQQSLRLEWPGACEFPEEPGPLAAMPSWSPVGPDDAPWPAWALAQAADGTVGVFTEGPHTVVYSDDRRLVSAGAPPGRPRAAVAVPSGAAARFLLVTDRRQEGAAASLAFLWVEDVQGELTTGPATLTGLAAPEALDVRALQWVDTDAGRRLLLLGGRGGRGVVVVCAQDGAGLTCTESALSGAVCADVGVVRSLVATRRGWLAVGPGGYAEAAVSGGSPTSWWCQRADKELLSVNANAPPELLAVQPVSVGALSDRAFVCLEVADLRDVALVFQAPLGADAPFEGAGLAWQSVNGGFFEPVRCGEFSRDPDQLLDAAPDRLRLDAATGLVDVFADGTSAVVDQWAYRQRLGGDPITATLQRDPGWVLHRTGWAVEPEALGAAILTVGVDRAYRHVYGRRDATAYNTVAPRADDFVAYNAFTDALPLRITPRPDASAPSGHGADLVAVEQDQTSELRLGPGEAVEDAQYDPATGELWLVGNSWVTAEGGSANSDRQWKPFFRRLSPGLEHARDVPVPLERGAFLCDITPLAPGLYLLAGGQGALLIYDGTSFLPVEVEYDDRDTEAVEVEPFEVNSGEPSADLLAVDAAGGVGWAVGIDGLVLRVARERQAGVPRWVARRVSLDRVAQDSLRIPFALRPRLTHVRALAPDHVVLVANRRTRLIGQGCPRVRQSRTTRDTSDIVQITPTAGWRQLEAAVAPGSAAPWPLGFSSWWPYPAPDGFLPEIVPHGLVGERGGLSVVSWEDGVWREDGAVAGTPFYPTAVSYRDDLGWVLAGPNARVAVAE
ncbi:MAG: hypothetical protein KC933_07400 [Myxococcales bacterium]|nr:hypothetical protein [Myxococcales bacterium]MCB9648598.1 hypothetical protein [Deltaproteobacteria bacterium]